MFLNTVMRSHIHPAGWHNWDNPDNEATAFYAEYGTQGVDTGDRVAWSKQLTGEEASQYTVQNVLRGSDGSVWIPIPPTVRI